MQSPRMCQISTSWRTQSCAPPANVTANSVARERRTPGSLQTTRPSLAVRHYTLWPTTLLLSHATNEALPVKRPPAQSAISPYGEEPTSRRVRRWSRNWSSMKRVHRTCGTKSCSVFPLSREVTESKYARPGERTFSRCHQDYNRATFFYSGQAS